jgi:hypothetical protein
MDRGAHAVVVADVGRIGSTWPDRAIGTHENRLVRAAHRNADAPAFLGHAARDVAPDKARTAKDRHEFRHAQDPPEGTFAGDRRPLIWLTRRKSSHEIPQTVSTRKGDSPSPAGRFMSGSNGCRPATHIVLRPALGRALPASAQDITLSAPGAEEELVERLRANALLLQETEGHRSRRLRTSCQPRAPIMPASSERSTSSGISRRSCGSPLDGREAANLSPLRRARAHRSSGRNHRGARPDLHLRHRRDRPPCRQHRDMPEDFRPGGPASTPVLQARHAAPRSNGWREPGTRGRMSRAKHHGAPRRCHA